MAAMARPARMINAVALLALVVLSSSGASAGSSSSSGRGAAGEDSSSTINPIRRVVTLLQNMAKKVTEEGKQEEELYEKFQCYCKTSGGDLQKSIAENDAQVPQLQSDIESSEAAKKQAEADLKAHQDGRAKAKEAAATATAIREKEAAAFAKESSELKANLAALGKAITSLEKGMVGGFLQTAVASQIRHMVAADASLTDFDRDTLTAFLSGATSDTTHYVPQSGQIVGILKTMKDDFGKDLDTIVQTEDTAKKNYEELMEALAKEIAAHTEGIEKKTKLIGELAVKIIEMKNSLSDAEAALIQDKKFLQGLEESCATQDKEWEERKKTRADELVAIYDTIKILNDDDALEMFKKTLPSPALLQVQTRSGQARHRALDILNGVRSTLAVHNADVDLIALALTGKQVDLTKVFKMIDDLVALLGKEQQEDDVKKEYCETQLDQMEDKSKDLKRKIDDLDTAIAAEEESIKAVTSDIKALNEAIKTLDKAVLEATEIRKKEHEDFTELMASDSAAKDLILYAKNRLHKFYNPKLYKPPPKRELTEEERIYTNNGGELEPTPAPGGIAGTGISALQQARAAAGGRAARDAPPPPPETFGAYKKKTEESGGVLAMLDRLVRDLDKEMQEAGVQEEEAQKDYEEMMSDSAAKRAEDSKALVDKKKAKADAETSLSEDTDAKKSTSSEFMAAEKYTEQLHGECDWLLQNFDLRKQARADEVDALKRAKAVLAGADFSLTQVHAHGTTRAQ